jgi:hypothetical protein
VPEGCNRPMATAQDVCTSLHLARDKPRRLYQSFRLARGLRLRRSAWPAARTARGLLAVYRARQPLACGCGWGELPGGTRARCGEAPVGGLAGKVALFFLLCCRCCQALLRIFFSLHSILLRRCVTWPRSRWRLPVALGPRVSNDLLSVRVPTPVTRCSLRLSTTAERPVGGDPISTTASLQGPEK